MGHPQQQKKAGGDIRVCRFTKISTAEDFTSLEADANEWVSGISGPAAQDAPIPSASVLAAADGDYFTEYSDGDICQLYIGSGGVTRGARIKSDADGKGVLALTTGTTEQLFGAEALETAIEDDLCWVRIVRGRYYPALS